MRKGSSSSTSSEAWKGIFNAVLLTLPSELTNANVTLPGLGPVISRDFRSRGQQIFPGRHVAQRLVWSFFVVLLEPLLSLFSDFTQALKHKHVEHRFPVAPIEPLDETVLHRLSRFDELEHHAMLLGPVSQSHGNKLWSIVQPQLEWIAAHSGDPLKRAHHPRGRQIEVNFNRQQLAIEIVHDVECPEAPPTPQRVAGKIR